jgi:hypothetical protein
MASINKYFKQQNLNVQKGNAAKVLLSFRNTVRNMQKNVVSLTHRSLAVLGKTTLLCICKYFKLQILNVQKSNAENVLLSFRNVVRNMQKNVAF